MKRRTTLEILLGVSNSKKDTIFSLTNSFEPFTGTWDFSTAAHLLRRTTFGPTKAEINLAVEEGLDATIERLFGPTPEIDPPVYYDFENDPLVALGETWIHTLPPTVSGVSGARRRSFLAWRFKSMRDTRLHIIEKLSLFWHNHFVVANSSVPRQMYTYQETIRRNALGNFKTFVEEITIDSSMLVYLNGTQNRENGPNENYARELLELFTLGKGPTVAPGDYTYYTEEDIIQVARALTGWRHTSPITDGFDPTISRFLENLHDEGEKLLSPRFDSQIITNEGENEYKRVIEIIFQKPQAANFICEKLYRWFVHPEISPEAEVNVIAPMTQMMIDNNYEIKEVLKTLLSSQEFYAPNIRGCMIAHPIDHLFKVISTLEVPFSSDFTIDFKILNIYQNLMIEHEMAIHLHPNVAGWKPFYQTPQLDKLWISSVSLGLRQTFIQSILDGFNREGFRTEIDVLALTASLENPEDPNDLIEELGNLIFVQPLNEEQITVLKERLVQGLPDFEWTVEYGAYIEGDLSLEDAVKSKLKSLFGTMLNMPEFHFI